jgi:hypothetical protein
LRQVKLINSIVSLHFNYAILFTTSPVFLGSATIWNDLSQTSDGYAQLERARDSAFALIHAICTVSVVPLSCAGIHADYSLKLAEHWFSKLMFSTTHLTPEEWTGADI